MIVVNFDYFCADSAVHEFHGKWVRCEGYFQIKELKAIMSHSAFSESSALNHR
jgi:hypothetical protein